VSNTASDSVRRWLIVSAITRELPNNVPFPAKADLIRDAMLTWPEVSRDLLTEVRPIIEELLDEMIKTSFGKYEGNILPSQVKLVALLWRRHSH
jgi:hypothetical protein